MKKSERIKKELQDGSYQRPKNESHLEAQRKYKGAVFLDKKKEEDRKRCRIQSIER